MLEPIHEGQRSEVGYLQSERLCWIGVPCASLNAALEWVVDWYRAFHTGADLRAMTLMQIERYEGLAQT